jgi:hypothetical protein
MSAELTSNANRNAFYIGDDIAFKINGLEKPFADMTEVEVDFVVDDTNKKTMKKSLADLFEIIEDPDDASGCIARAFRAETAEWTEGKMFFAIRLTYPPDDLWPEGNRVSYQLAAGTLEKLPAA